VAASEEWIEGDFGFVGRILGLGRLGRFRRSGGKEDLGGASMIRGRRRGCLGGSMM